MPSGSGEMAIDLTTGRPDAMTAGQCAAGEDARGVAAARLARGERLRHLVLAVLAAAPSGFTADEIAERLGESVLAVRPRVSELFHAGLIEKTGERRRNQSGLSAHVWTKPAARVP
jgi:DNA-binding transcriptional ArsR family regulator